MVQSTNVNLKKSPDFRGFFWIKKSKNRGTIDHLSNDPFFLAINDSSYQRSDISE